METPSARFTYLWKKTLSYACAVCLLHVVEDLDLKKLLLNLAGIKFEEGAVWVLFDVLSLGSNEKVVPWIFLPYKVYHFRDISIEKK